MSNYAPRYRVKAISPIDADVWAYLPFDDSGFTFEIRNAEPGTFRGVLKCNVDQFGDESAEWNPLRLNGALQVLRGFETATPIDWSAAEIRWQGKVTDLELLYADGFAELHVLAVSKLGILMDTGASINGERTGALNTPTIDIDEAELVRVESASLSEFAYFPLASVTDAWLDTTFQESKTTLDTGINDTIDTIIGDTTHHGFPASGVLIIDMGGTEEWVYYNGYQNDGAGGKYTFYNCQRGAFGTTAAAHLAGVTLTKVIPATIAAQRACFLEKQAAAGSPTIPGEWRAIGEFAPVPVDGYFGFQFDVLGFNGEDGPWEPAPRATYAVYDATSASAVTYASVLRLLLDEPTSLGGPGWVENTDYQIDDGTGTGPLDSLVFARFQISEPVSTWDAIEELTTQAGLRIGDVDDALVVSEDPETGIVHFALVTQLPDASAADVQLYGTIDQTGSRSLENIVSNVLVSYEEPVRKNLLGADRCWHPDGGDTVGTQARSPVKIIYQKGDNGLQKATGGRGWQSENITSNAQRVGFLFDDNRATAWGLQITDTTPFGEDIRVLVAWFPDPDADGDPDPVNLSYVQVMGDFGWNLRADGYMHFEVFGLTGAGMDLTTDPPTYNAAMWPTGNVVRLSGKMEVRYFWEPNDDDNMSPFTNVELVVDDIGQNCKGLIFVWSNPCDRNLDNGEGRAGTMALRDIRAEGPRRSTVLIQTTATTGQDDTYFYSPDANAKLRDVTYGAPRQIEVDLGRASRAEAIATGRSVLLASLLLIHTHRFTVQGWSTAPRVGLDTVEVLNALALADGDFAFTPVRGLIDQYSVTVTNAGGIDAEAMSLWLKDYGGGLFGTEDTR